MMFRRWFFDLVDLHEEIEFAKLKNKIAWGTYPLWNDTTESLLWKLLYGENDG